MKINFLKIRNSEKTLVKPTKRKLFFIFLLMPLLFFAQNEPMVSASVDSTQIKIGEQIIYSIAVETEPENVVVFPEGQTFSPLEMVENFEVDTTRAEGNLQFLKEYALTVFDSGSYAIPRQKVLVGENSFFTDSIQIEVDNVEVDTTKQKLFPIKASVDVPEPFEIPNWVWWLLGTLIILGAFAYFIFRRKKKKEAKAAKLPPYEQAFVELEDLDHSHLLEDRELKEYYSRLTAVVRKYLDEQVYDRALESTTGELITYLELKKNAGELQLNETIISDLKIMLERADLAKFANSKPDIFTAKADRASAEKIINETKTAIPEPTEEELLKDEKLQEEKAQKRKKKKIALTVIASIVILVAGIAVFFSIKGDSLFENQILGNQSKELLEGNWIRSEYANPSISVTTPEVLMRQIDSAENAAETFAFGNIRSDLYVKLSSESLPQENLDRQAMMQRFTADLEAKGAKNILTKDEVFTSIDGTEGVQLSGNFVVENPSTAEEIAKDYLQVNFVRNNLLQQLMVSYNPNDEYAQEIAERIINSVELNNIEN